jgi:type VI protein secretion system component Hcp
MHKIILVLLLFPLTALAQKQDVYLKLTDASGQQIKGDAVTKGYERTVGVLSFSTAGKNNAQLSFNMNVTGTSADLKRAMSSGTLLPNGILTVTKATMGAPAIVYTIKMENITVNNCTESMGCNGVLNSIAVITAARIGWTYYQQDASGKLSVSRKYGFDNDSGKEWTNF